ncbi:MAG: replicative DNA helicase [Endomicrobia bacterium]|nr:replicative DNA helicase [Endomicrobiia bacterium]MCX7941433.1 replicative DNA helicase [Endomicrobiia bacterium]MDW8055463.1 replicative DNA helicase [Elusimicrobiota bacterium]
MAIKTVEVIDKLPERVPPYSQEAEIAVLGAMLIDKDTIPKVLSSLVRDDFYIDAHAIIFETIRDMHLNNIVVDFVTLTEQLKKRNILDRVGGAGYITSLVDLVSSSANVDHYISLVKEKSMLRALIKTSARIIEESYSNNKTAAEIINVASEQIFKLVREHYKTGYFVHVKQPVDETLERIDKMMKKPQEVGVIPTGFKKLDEFLAGGLQKSNFVIIAGRPGMGKTSFAMNIAANVAITKKIPVGILSLEMTANELILRLLCSRARIDSNQLRKGILKKEQWVKLTTHAGIISESPLYIDDSPDLNILELRTRTRRLAHELQSSGQQLGLIIVDYIQRMNGINPRDTRQQEIADISNAMKSLAKELEIPVIGISQLSRKPEEKDRDKRPRLSDLRESGALEQDADVVIFIYTPEKKKSVAEEGIETVAETRLYIAKNRNGPTGEIPMLFIKEHTIFTELEAELEE